MPHIQIQFRRDTSASWTCADPILASGELGIELDTKQFKIGDGHTRWRLLPYGGLQGPPGPAGLILPPQTPQQGQVLTYVGGSPSAIQWRDQLSYNTTTAVIKAPVGLTHFDFSNPRNEVFFSEKFGTGYQGGTSANPSATDTDGFFLTMHPSYNMLNLPIITGTIAYWDISEPGGIMRYVQIKFGNVPSSNSLSMTIKPTTLLTNNDGGYGSPLTLQISGITRTTAFNSAGNIASIGELNYAIFIYLQINNSIPIS
jgi:hypothetical protein